MYAPLESEEHKSDVGYAYSSFNKHVLRGGTGCSDTVNASLVEFRNESVGWHVMELVVAVKDNIAVRRELGCHILPESLEVRCRSDDTS